MDFVIVLPRIPLGHEVVWVIVDQVNVLHPVKSRMFLGEDSQYLCQGDSKASWSTGGYSVR